MYVLLTNRYVVDLSSLCFFFQAEDGIRDLVRSRGLGDVYKRQGFTGAQLGTIGAAGLSGFCFGIIIGGVVCDKIGYLSLIHI